MVENLKSIVDYSFPKIEIYIHIPHYYSRYLKDHDNYQRMAAEREREERPKNYRKRTRQNSGCLCFSSSSSSSLGEAGGVKSRRDCDIYERNISN